MALTAKIVSCCTVFIVTFFFGVLPCGIVRMLNRRTQKPSKQQRYISWMNCLSGGVFFGTTFVHLVPESREELGKVIDIEYPVAEVLVSGGFFLVLLLEHLFGLCFVCCRTVSISDKNELLNGTHITENEYEITEIKRTSLKRHIVNSLTEETRINGDIGQTNISYSSNNDISRSDHESDTVTATNVGRKSPVTVETMSDIEIVDDGRVSSITGRSTTHVYEDIDGTINDSEEEKISVFRATVLVIALSLHMIFEGLALGLQDKVPAIWTLLIVISVHKSIVAASVGLKLNDVMKRMTQISLCLFIFSLVTPLGIVIGILINSLTATENMVSGVMECVATGSFLYVTFFEILQREFVHEHHNMIKVLLAFIGFGVSAGAKLLQLYFH